MPLLVTLKWPEKSEDADPDEEESYPHFWICAIARPLTCRAGESRRAICFLLSGYGA